MCRLTCSWVKGLKAFQKLSWWRQYVVTLPTAWPRCLWCADVDSRLKNVSLSLREIDYLILFEFCGMRNAEKKLRCNLRNIPQVKFRKIQIYAFRNPDSAKYTFSSLPVLGRHECVPAKWHHSLSNGCRLHVCSRQQADRQWYREMCSCQWNRLWHIDTDSA